MVYISQPAILAERYYPLESLANELKQKRITHDAASFSSMLTDLVCEWDSRIQKSHPLCSRE